MSEESPSSSSSDSTILSLQHHLASCSRSIEAGDYSDSDRSVSELVEFLNSTSDTVLQEAENEDSERKAFQILTEIHRFTTSPSLNLEVVEALSFELPKAVCKLACASKRCSDLAESFIDHLLDKCGPREMLSILCDALSSPNELFQTSLYYAPLLSGIAKVLIRIQRRQFEQVKAAVPVVLQVLNFMALQTDDEDADAFDLFSKAIDIADSVQAVCAKLMDNQKLHALFGLLILQLMGLVSLASRARTADFLSIVLHLSHFLHFCGLSYIGLITGCDVDKITNIMVQSDRDDEITQFSYAKHGASLTVIWGYKFGDVAVAAAEDIAAVGKELQNNQTKRWQAVGMLKHVFSCAKLSWDLKRNALDFLLSIMDGCECHEAQDEEIDCSYMPSLHAGLLAIQSVIMYGPDAVIRKNAYEAFNKVLADIPSSLRFDILKALIKNCDSSSMIGILMDCVRREMHAEYSKRTSVDNGGLEAKIVASKCPIFWDDSILDLVELVLKPPTGGPPSLPEYTDAVLAALNLYRFVLITESAGKTNYTSVLSKEKLEKAHSGWLLPLRTLVTGVMAENQKDYDQLAQDTMCSLNPIVLVLFRCIELVEEKMKLAV
nr:aberrant root formation protein 4 [Ipomoea trifida]